MEPSIDAWLLVWAGPGDWRSHVARALERGEPRSEEAHTILSRELDGERWSLLLVHYTEAERDAVVTALQDLWAYGFVNAVVDLTEIES